jgi:hypothetical protein
MSKITATPPESLSPTQLTVGMIEVRDKQKQLAALKAPEQEEFLRAHPIPTVVGPHGTLYITDHHHLGRAALEAGVGKLFCETEADFSSHDWAGFWKEMEENSWVHPLDEHGVRHIYSRLPARLAQMVDDVYRSLAAYVRNAGGYDKTGKAYAEFVWADFFRRNVAVEIVTGDFEAAVRTALPLAKSHRAKSLPGFKGE